MNFMDIKTLDIANGPGCRISLFVSGCTHHCKGCFNPESWDFEAGEAFTPEIENKLIDLLAPDYIDGFTILGGEPFEESNAQVLLPFLRKVREKYPDLSIWMYSGYRFEDILYKDRSGAKILHLIDVLVDGRFQENEKNIKLQYCGSLNQRIIDVKMTLEHFLTEPTQTIICYDQFVYDKDKTCHQLSSTGPF